MTQITLTNDQEAARKAFLAFLANDDSYLQIKGAAGTGKSFLIKHLLSTFHSQYKAYCLFLDREPEHFDINVTATTNKAVSVVDAFLGHMPEVTIQTIYRLLGLRVVNNYDTGQTNLEFTNNTYVKPSDKRPLILIDEASFIDDECQKIIEQVLVKEAKAKVIYIGDPFQLAPVGQNFSVFDSVKCKEVTMREVKRNGGHILKVGSDFRHVVETKDFCEIDYNGVDVVHATGPEFRQMVHDAYGTKDWTADKTRILGWTNERVQAYNNYIRDYLGYPATFEVGETVITNEYISGNHNYMRSVDSEVEITQVNREIETIYDVPGQFIELDNSHCGFRPLDFKQTKRVLKQLRKEKNWKRYFEIKERWLDLRAVYASSIHKSQGSTYETVFIDLTDIGKSFNGEDASRLLYVALTRASQRVVCYGYLPPRFC